MKKEYLAVLILFFSVVTIPSIQAHPAGSPGTFGALDIKGCHIDRGKIHCHKKEIPDQRWFHYEVDQHHSLREYQEQFCDANKGRMNHPIKNYQGAVNHPAAQDKRFGTLIVGCETFEHAVEFAIDTEPNEIVFDRALLSAEATNKSPVIVYFKTDIGRKDDFMIRLKEKCEENDVLFIQSNVK